MRVWRLAVTRYARSVEQMLSGEGARRVGGRWSPPGVAAVYCAETASLAVLEVLVHLPTAADFNRLGYRLLDLEVPDETIAAPAGSLDDTQAVGASLLSEHLAFTVPSVVNSLERNVVLNPAHPAFVRVTAGRLRPFFLDRRLSGS